MGSPANRTDIITFCKVTIQILIIIYKEDIYGLKMRLFLISFGTDEPVAVAEWVARQTAEQEVGSSNPGIPPLLKHACGKGDWLLCWQYTPAKGVAPEVNLRKHILCTPPLKQGYQWPHKWTCVQQKFKKKKKKKIWN